MYPQLDQVGSFEHSQPLTDKLQHWELAQVCPVRTNIFFLTSQDAVVSMAGVSQLLNAPGTHIHIESPWYRSRHSPHTTHHCNCCCLQQTLPVNRSHSVLGKAQNPLSRHCQWRPDDTGDTAASSASPQVQWAFDFCRASPSPSDDCS